MKELIGTIFIGKEVSTSWDRTLKVYYDYDTVVFSIVYTTKSVVGQEVSLETFYKWYKWYPNVTSQFDAILKKVKRDKKLKDLLEWN